MYYNVRLILIVSAIICISFSANSATSLQQETKELHLYLI